MNPGLKSLYSFFLIISIGVITVEPILFGLLPIPYIVLFNLGYAITAITVIVLRYRNQIENEQRAEQELREKRQLAEQAQQRADQLDMVNKVSNAISNLQSLGSIIQLIFKQVQAYIPLDVFYIALYDEKSGRITFPLMYDSGKFWDEPARNIHETSNVGEAIKTGQLILLNRSAEEVRRAKETSNRVGDQSRVAASIIVIPLQAAKRRIGALSVQSYQLRAYDQNQVSLLTALAQQVTVAIENARLYEQANQRAQRLSVLNEIGKEISTLRDLPALMETVYQQMRKTLPTDLFFIGLYDASKNELTFPIMYDDGRHWEQEPTPATEDTFSGKAILTRRPLLVTQWADPDQPLPRSRIIVGDAERITNSLMFAPMIYSTEIIGVISIQSYAANAYTEEDLELLVGIANQVAIAIQNTRLLETTQQNAQHLAILNEVGRTVAELRHLPDLLEVIYVQVKQILHADAFYVGLYHAESNMVSYPITYDNGLRYDSKPDPVSPQGYLHRMLQGAGASLINRTAAELIPELDAQGMLGDTTRKSASILLAPLKISEQVIGIISAQSYTLNAYKSDDLNLLVGIANQVAIAIENSRLYTAAQQEIDERRKIEEQLRTAEAKYRELVERVPAVIYSSETGAEGRWFYVSPQIEALLGFTPEEWLADRHLWYRQIYPEDRQNAVEAEAAAVEKGVKVEMDYRMYTKGGRLLWIHDESLSVSFSDNEQYVVQGILTDITLRKQAELRLRDSEERYHSLFVTTERQARELALLSDVQSALARELDLSELIHTVVEAISKTFGYMFVSLYTLEDGHLQLQHAVGYKDVIEQIPRTQGVVGRVLRTQQPILISDVRYDADFLRADQGIRSEICVPLFNGDLIFGVLNVESPPEYQLNEDDLKIMLTLSEQVNIAIRRASLYAERAENLRREQHINDFAHAISSTVDLAVILERVTKVSAELVGAETATVSLTAEDGTEITDAYTYNEFLYLQKLLSRGQGLTWHIYETGRPIILDKYAAHPNASPEWSASGVQAFMGFPIIVGEKKLGAFSVYSRNPEKRFTQRDFRLMEAIAREVAIAIQNARLFAALQKELEERKRVEREREAMFHDLEAKNAELERFTYTVSHDLKSPLVTIAGFLGFLENDIKKGDTERFQNNMHRIHEAAVRMHRLLDELLELSRVGRLANPSVEVSFGELAREALELAEGQLAARQVQVRIEADLPVVFVDRIRMIEVLQNLIVNAIKFMGTQSQPTIEIGMEVQNGKRIFFVRDNGIGIAPEYHERIFGLFNKLDQSSDGTGIGLALVRRIIEVHNGKIWVESEPGKGATFFFTLAE
jgi:PAS domain S-box-containing protein